MTTTAPHPNDIVRLELDGDTGAGICAAYACGRPVPEPRAVRTPDGRVYHFGDHPHDVGAWNLSARIAERPDGYWSPTAAARLTRPGETLAVQTADTHPPVWIAHSEPAGAGDCALRPFGDHPAGGYGDPGGLAPCPNCAAYVIRPGTTAALRTAPEPEPWNPPPPSVPARPTTARRLDRDLPDRPDTLFG